MEDISFSVPLEVAVANMSRLVRKLPKMLEGLPQSRSLHCSSSLRTTFSPTNAVLEKPHQSKFINYVCVAMAVGTGISAGAWLSKNIASFLEENELFVPSDDDDDF
ncbi:Essential MCU regulator mitochondrial [Trinorchestia longiramus]|nr:Essential MCU regulator mitochondrial [Trinorchestia longiramus]